MVWPTMSGMMVERRDQVLMTFFSPLELRTSTFLSRCPSTNGPFFRLRGMAPRPHLPPRAAGAAPAHDHRIGLLVAGAGAALGLAPRRDRMAATRGLALAAAERVVDRVHRHATRLGSLALPAVAARLAHLDELGLGVAHDAE